MLYNLPQIQRTGTIQEDPSMGEMVGLLTVQLNKLMYLFYNIVYFIAKCTYMRNCDVSIYVYF
jgi:hypothetical protein